MVARKAVCEDFGITMEAHQVLRTLRVRTGRTQQDVASGIVLATGPGILELMPPMAPGRLDTCRITVCPEAGEILSRIAYGRGRMLSSLILASPEAEAAQAPDMPSPEEEAEVRRIVALMMPEILRQVRGGGR